MSRSKAVKEQRKKVVSLQDQAYEYYDNKNYEAAVDYYTRSLENVPPKETQAHYIGLYMLGACYIKLQQPELAIQNLKRAYTFLSATQIDNKRDTSYAIIKAQNLLVDQNKKRTDIDELSKKNILNELCVEIIDASTELLNVREALLLNVREALHESRLKACINYSNTNDAASYKEFIIEDTTYYINLINNKKDININDKMYLFFNLRSRGATYLKLDDYEKALSDFELIEERFRSQVDLEFMTRAYAKLERYDEALECANKISSKKHSIPSIPTNALYFLYAKTEAEVNKGLYPEATRTLGKIISYIPNAPEPYMDLIYCYQKLQQIDESNELCKIAINICILKLASINKEKCRKFIGEEHFAELFPEEVTKDEITSGTSASALETIQDIPIISNDTSIAIEKAAIEVESEKELTIASNDTSIVHEKISILPESTKEPATDDKLPNLVVAAPKRLERKPLRYKSRISKEELGNQPVVKWAIPSDGQPIPDMNGKNKGFGKAWSDWLPETATLYTYFDKKSDSIVQLRASKKTDHGLYKQLKGIITDGHIVGPTAESGIKPLSGPMKGKFEAKIISERAKKTRIYGEEVSSLDGRHKLILFRECRAAMHH